jgi:MFS family permease
VSISSTERSYRALFAVPSIRRILLTMQIARIAQAMVGVAIVLFTLLEYRSPVLAGLVTFTSIAPGLLVSPIAGALLDRHGRVRLVILDYFVAMGALVLIGILALGDALAPPLLIAITAVSSLTGILSVTGLRSLFPLIVPRHLWERASAVDSNGYVVATILGPPVAAALVGIVGGPITLIAIGFAYGLSAVAMIGIPDPKSVAVSTGRLLVDAWQGVVYAWRNRTIRGLGFSISVLNLNGGMQAIVIPLIVLDRLDLPESVVGLLFALSGLTGMASAILFGRLDTRGREWLMLVAPMALTAPVVALLLIAALPGVAVMTAVAIVAISLGLTGFLNGPMDIALFTVRMRRTDPAWMGRAFAVSMAFNFSGFPLGAALAGPLAAASIEGAIVLGVVAAAAASVIAARMIPRAEPPPVGSASPSLVSD